MTTQYRMVVDKVVQDMSAAEAAQATGGGLSYTTAQRDALVGIPAGYVIYNSTTNKLNIKTVAGWEAVTSA